VADVGNARVAVDVEDATKGERNLDLPANSCVRPLAEQIIGRGGVGQRPAGKGHQELQIDGPLGAVARAAEKLELRLDQVEVHALVPGRIEVPLPEPVPLLEKIKQRDEAAVGAQ